MNKERLLELLDLDADKIDRITYIEVSYADRSAQLFGLAKDFGDSETESVAQQRMDVDMLEACIIRRALTSPVTVSDEDMGDAVKMEEEPNTRCHNPDTPDIRLSSSIKILACHWNNWKTSSLFNRTFAEV